MITVALAEAACAAHNADLVRRKEMADVEELDAAARAAGAEVVAEVRYTHRDVAVVELPGEGEPVRVPAADVAAGLGVPVAELAGRRVAVTVRESRSRHRSPCGPLANSLRRLPQAGDAGSRGLTHPHGLHRPGQRARLLPGTAPGDRHCLPQCGGLSPTAMRMGAAEAVTSDDS